MAQDVGIHRKKTYEPKQTVEDELWKRAFWYVDICLLYISLLNGNVQGFAKF